jgi:hypothetical protein
MMLIQWGRKMTRQARRRGGLGHNPARGVAQACQGLHLTRVRPEF